MRRRLYVRIKEIALPLQCDATLRKRRIKTNANPPLVSTDYDPLPNIAEEHAGEFFVSAARFEYRIEHSPGLIAPNSCVRIDLAAFNRRVRDRSPVRIRRRDQFIQAPIYLPFNGGSSDNGN